MNRLLALTLVAITPTLVVGCGDDEDADGTPPQEVEVNPQQATASTQLTASAITQAQSGEGLTAANSLFSAGSSAWTMITPAASGQSEARSANCETACTETSCTFSGCTSGGIEIEGTMSWGSGKLLCDLNYALTNEAGSYDFSLQCDVTYTDTSIDGFLKTQGEYDVQGTKTTWDTKVDYDAVTLNGAGCPTGGTISVDANVTTSGQSSGGTGTYTFDGSGC